MPTFTLGFTWRDSEGIESTFPLHFDTTDVTEIADVQAIYDEYKPILEALSGAIIVGGSFSWDLVPGTLGTPDSGYFLNSGATLSFRNSDGVADSMYLPAILNANLVGQVVNSETAGMVALIAEATGAGAATPVSTYGSGSAWTTYRRGYQSQRKIKR